MTGSIYIRASGVGNLEVTSDEWHEWKKAEMPQPAAFWIADRRRQYIEALENGMHHDSQEITRLRGLLSDANIEYHVPELPAEPEPVVMLAKKNCRACAHSYMEPDSGLICGHDSAGTFGATIVKEPMPFCGWKLFEQHPHRNPNGTLK